MCENTKGKIIDLISGSITLDKNKEIRVSESIRDGEEESMVDIRIYNLFAINGLYDNKKKATNRGVHFSFELLPNIIIKLIRIYEVHYGRKFDVDKYKSEVE